VDRERVIGAAALLVLVALLAVGAAVGADGDEDCAAGDPRCQLDEVAGTYGPVGIGSSVEVLRMALGEPRERVGGYAPAGRLPAEVGVPLAVPSPDGVAPAVYRYDDVAFLLSADGVYSFMVTAEEAETTRGVGVGDSLDDAREAFPGLKCGDAAGGEALLPFQDSTYPFCRAVLGPKRFLWFGKDPIASITLTDYSDG
jgi:hypothetical protein